MLLHCRGNDESVRDTTQVKKKKKKIEKKKKNK